VIRQVCDQEAEHWWVLPACLKWLVDAPPGWAGQIRVSWSRRPRLRVKRPWQLLLCSAVLDSVVRHCYLIAQRPVGLQKWDLRSKNGLMDLMGPQPERFGLWQVLLQSNPESRALHTPKSLIPSCRMALHPFWLAAQAELLNPAAGLVMLQPVGYYSPAFAWPGLV
jgi:hypothetical protein